MRIYDRLRFGHLAEISLLDGRQYRSREACYGPPKTAAVTSNRTPVAPSDANRRDRCSGSTRRIGCTTVWLNRRRAGIYLAQDVLMAQLRERNSRWRIQFWSDDWNGYPAARQRLMQLIHACRVSNPVVLTGDIHSFWANDLKLDFDDADARSIATEFVGTSVSAHPPPYDLFASYAADNPHVRYFESRKRGYVTVDVEAERLTTNFRGVSDATDPNATVQTLKSFIVEDGHPGAKSL